jgi:putative nucleotidyltransferase-like protein
MMTRYVDPDLPSEERLLLAIGKLDPSQEDREVAHELLAAIGYPWRRTLELAIAHRVHPMLAHNLENDASFKSHVPDEFQASLRVFRSGAAMRRAVYNHAIAPIIELLAAEDIRLILMKGAAITETLYPPGSRLLNDVDILIDRRDYVNVTSAFSARGFSKVFREGRTEAGELDSYHQMSLVRRVGDADLIIDLHWLMYPPDRTFCQIDTPSLIARARKIQFGATSSFVMSPEDTLVHLASQLVNDSLRVDYQRMADIYAVAKSPLSWETTVEIATAGQAAGATHLALSIASMLSATVPAFVFRELRRQCAGCHVASRYFAVPSLAFRPVAVPHVVSPVLFSLLYERFSDRCRYVIGFVSSWWSVGRGDRGALRSCWLVMASVGRAVLWGVKQVAGRRTTGYISSTRMHD